MWHVPGGQQSLEGISARAVLGNETFQGTWGWVLNGKKKGCPTGRVLWDKIQSALCIQIHSATRSVLLAQLAQGWGSSCACPLCRAAWLEPAAEHQRVLWPEVIEPCRQLQAKR